MASLMIACVEARQWHLEESPWDAQAIADAVRVRVSRLDGGEVELAEAELTEGGPSFFGLLLLADGEFEFR